MLAAVASHFCPSCGETVEFPTRTFLLALDANDPFEGKEKGKVVPRNLKSSIHSAYGGIRSFLPPIRKKLGEPIEIENVMASKPHSNMIPTFNGQDGGNSDAPEKFALDTDASVVSNAVCKVNRFQRRRGRTMVTVQTLIYSRS